MARPLPFASIQKALGRRVRAARVEAGLTQEEAASRSKIDYKRWQRIESGDVNMTVRTLVRVASVLDTSFWNLVGGDEK